MDKMRIFLCILGIACTAVAKGELPSPRLDRVQPLGASAGTTVEITVTGQDLEGAKQILCDFPGITAKHVKDKTFALTVASNVEPGTYDLWVVGKHGISNPRLFAVSKGMTEIAEKSPNNDASSAQPVAMNVVVNGTSDQNREDWFRFPGKKNQRVIIECQSAVLDTAMDANLVLTAANRKQLASNGDHNGRDPLLDLVLPEDGEYTVGLFDLSYRGGQPYRLTISDRPQLENLSPRAIQLGKPTTLTLFGRNLGAKAKPSKWAEGDLPLDEQSESVTLAAKDFERAPFRFAFHPTGHSVLPTAATCTLVGQQIHGVPVLVTDSPVTLEKEPNDSAETAQAITLPAVVSGRFDKPRDADWYEFTPTVDGQHSFNVYCERIAGRADPYLVVVDEKGNRVAEFDDFGHRMLAFDGHLRDPVGMTSLNKGKKYRVLVQDRYRRGGARYQYVLTVNPPKPDFFVAAIHNQNPGPGGLNLLRGGASYLDVIVHQTDGYQNPITIQAENLPKGVHLSPTTLTGTNQGAVVFWCDDTAEESTAFVKLTATGTRGETVLIREVRPYARVSNSGDATSRPMREQPLAILAEKTPFSLAFEKERIEIVAGQKADLKLKLDRKWADFKGNVNLQSHAFPGSIKFGGSSIGDGKNEGTVTLEIQNGARTGEYTLTVLGQAQVPYQKDEKAKGNTLVTIPSRPVTVVVLPKK